MWMGRSKTGIMKACVICGKGFYVRPSEAWKYSCCSLKCGLIRRSRLKTRFIDGLSDTPERRQMYARRCKLKQKYNMTIEEWETLFNVQGRCCANPKCRSTEPKDIRGYWHTDHDHLTERVRGILCRKCNLALGYVNDSTEILKGLIEYIENVTT